jgi:hypothetical protein
MIGGIIGIIMSILAYCTAAKKTPFFALPFFLLSIVAGAICLAAFVATISSATAIYYKNSVCHFRTGATRTGAELARQMNLNFVDKIMCSDTCPCENKYRNLWFDKYNEKIIGTLYQRTWAEKDNDKWVHMNFGKPDVVETVKETPQKADKLAPG